MYIVKHTFEDKYTGLPVLAGTIVELEEGERKEYLLKEGLVAVAEVLKLPNAPEEAAGAEKEPPAGDKAGKEEQLEKNYAKLPVKELKDRLKEKGIKCSNSATKEEMIQLLEEAE